MGFWKAIFSTPDVVKKTLDDVSSGIDKTFYTEEEKADDLKAYRSWLIRYMDATNPQNLSRRVIAIFVCGLFSVLVLLCVLVWPVSIAYAEYILNVLHELVLNPFLMILGFYFCTHLARAAFKKS